MYSPAPLTVGQTEETMYANTENSELLLEFLSLLRSLDRSTSLI